MYSFCGDAPHRTRRGATMSGVRVLVGTRKGAFILRADGARKNWDVSGPFFGGWEVFHMKGSQPHLRLAVDELVRAVDPTI